MSNRFIQSPYGDLINLDSIESIQKAYDSRTQKWKLILQLISHKNYYYGNYDIIFCTEEECDKRFDEIVSKLEII